ncbi:hypothetical protein BGX38DRAFT_1266052 [Terfezia claveryi]|nr:hypothetical protein BGX38DRAFT_1266052 [Terfezia claveryi]
MNVINTPNTPEIMEAGSRSGGFLLPSIPSPPVSIGSSLRIIGKQRPLPAPRPTPLKPGSKHETALVRFLDDGLLDISRKYTKKYTPGGYYDIQHIVQDLEKLVDLIWISATPSLQIQYLLQIANNLNDYLASFQLNLRVTFRFLDVLDRCFYALITGNSANPDSTPISAPMASPHFSMTAKVRLNSIIQRTRLHIIKIVEEGPSNIQGDEITDMPTQAEQSAGSVTDGASRDTTPATDIMDIALDNDTYEDDDEEDDIEWEMAAARVYELSLTEVGEQLLRSG